MQVVTTFAATRGPVYRRNTATISQMLVSREATLYFYAMTTQQFNGRPLAGQSIGSSLNREKVAPSIQTLPPMLESGLPERELP
jgi:hypothetical protein